MGVRRLEIENVRCIAEASLTLEPGRNFLIGPNGAGKTSCLEAIYLLGRGRSFRTRQLRQLLRHEAAALNVFAELDGEGEAGSDSTHRVGVGLVEGSLVAKLDGAVAESLAELARAFPVHVIDPKLHSLVEAGPSERRRFLDGGVFHVERSYLSRWRAYRRALAQRNAALKRGPGAPLAVWDAALVEAGLKVDALRRTYTAGLATAVATLGQNLLGIDVGVQYVQGWRSELSLAEALARSSERDRVTGFTQVGPHRADLQIAFASGGVREIASRGQQKLVAAALVLGQMTELKRRTGRAGTLLVDDPAAELDDRALQRLLGEISAVGAQSVITGLRIEPLGRAVAEPLFHVEQGRIEPVLY